MADDLPRTLDCRETIHAETNESLTNFRVSKDKFSVTFSQDEQGNFVMVGNLGSAPIESIRGTGFVQFLERTPLGPVQVTTILTKPDKDGIYKAVHSRNTAMLGTLLPSQIIMACRPR